MTKKTIAAIIPLYNGAAYIREALESVLAQERQPDEVIVVDDGSTDGGAGRAIVAEIAANDPRIKVLSKANGGQGSARNFGVETSTSDLIAFLDQDDIWYPHHLRILEKPFLKNSSQPFGWSYSNLDQIDSDGRMVCHSILDGLRTNEHPKRTLDCCLRQDMFILPGASIISRRAFDSVGGFDPQFTGYEDDDLFLRLFCKGWRSEYINKALTIWRIHTASTSYGQKMTVSRAKYFEKLVAIFPDNPDMNTYYSRDQIAPRFVKNALADLYKAINEKDQNRIDLAKTHIPQFSRKLSVGGRLKVKLVANIAVLPPTMWLLRWIPRRVVHRLMRGV